MLCVILVAAIVVLMIRRIEEVRSAPNLEKDRHRVIEFRETRTVPMRSPRDKLEVVELGDLDSEFCCALAFHAWKNKAEM